MKSTRRLWCTVAVFVVLVATAATASAQAAGDKAGNRKVSETFTATTTNMEPAGESIKFSVLRWSSEEDWHEVLSILTGEAESEDADSAELKPLMELPSVGCSLKYAYRLETPDGGGSELRSSQGGLSVRSVWSRGGPLTNRIHRSQGTG